MEVKDLEENDWFQPLLMDVQREFDRLMIAEDDQRPVLHQELQGIERNITGWSTSLANPALGASLRLAIEGQWEQAIARKQKIENHLAGHERRLQWLRSQLDPQKVLDCLQRLDNVLGGQNPTQANLELSLHIDRIDCFSDGKVVMRTCKLGALAGVAGIFRNPEIEPQQADTARMGQPVGQKPVPRRRQRLRVESQDRNEEDLEAAAESAADPFRFAGLSKDWFWEDIFQIPRRMCWSEQHAVEVAEYRLQHRVSIQETAQHFGKTPPTIRAALNCAKELGIDATGKTMNLPRSRGWAIAKAADVLSYVTASGCTEADAALHFRVAESSIRKALEHARSGA